MTESNALMNQRDSWFDNAKGFLMITVVLGHMAASAASKYVEFSFLLNYIYFFHMPAFAIISGFFMKRRVDTKDYASVINKTVIPYCFAQLIIYLSAMILPSGARALSAEHFAESGFFSFAFPIYHLWYFCSVVFAFLFCVAFKAKDRPMKAFVVSLIISLLCGVVPQVAFLKLTKALAFLPFFVLGYITPKESFVRFKERKYTVPSIGIVVGAGIVFWLIRDKGVLTGIFSLSMRYNSSYLGMPYWASVLVRLCFILTAVIFSFAFFNLCPKKRSILTPLGKRSVYIYVLHVLPIAVMRHLNYQYGILRILSFSVFKVVYVLIGVLLCYLLISKPVIKVFRRMFEPDFDIRKIPEYLKIKTEK